MSPKTREILQYALGALALITIAAGEALELGFGKWTVGTLMGLVGALTWRRPSDVKAVE